MLSGKVSQSGGGVGRNVADALGKLDVDTFLISAIGTDDLGGSILKTVPHLTGNGLLRCDKYPTATCYVICDASGECKILIGDMEIHDKISVHYVKKHEEKILSSSLVVLDGNLPQDTIFYLLDMCGEAGVPVWFEPTDIVKATKAFSAGRKHFPQFISPNYNELVEISNVVNPGFSPPSNEIPWLFTCTEQAKLLVENVDNVLVTLGKLGVVIFRRGEVTDPFFVVQDSGKPKYLKRNSPISHSIHPQEKILEGEVVNASGAGDCFASGFIAAMLTGADENECVRLGFQCSLASLRCKKTVPDKFAQKSIGEKD
ncbi:UNVERIFIED_CONTAM: hypothetical protein PYX00_002300 [Menopon gallinae]|uniref:Carbohydrate kinase PfkB domain-containing protein n=1 Tax=Menopon gallinae TaxID=328185 RepID=A0AAW2IG65_9NEOP